MSVKHDIACQLVLILSHSKEQALLMINYYYYNRSGSSRGKKKKNKSKGFIWKLNAQFSLRSILGKKGLWYLQRLRKQLQEDKSFLGRRGCGDAVPREALQGCGLAGGAGNSADRACRDEHHPGSWEHPPKSRLTVGHHRQSCVRSC